jgi:hypothetical protein
LTNPSILLQLSRTHRRLRSVENVDEVIVFFEGTFSVTRALMILDFLFNTLDFLFASVQCTRLKVFYNQLPVVAMTSNSLFENYKLFLSPESLHFFRLI